MRFTPRFSITNEIAAALTEIERARGFLEAASLSDEWIDSMRSRAFLLEAHHTTHIEEPPYDMRRPQTFLAGDDVPGADPDDTRETSHLPALQFVSTYLNEGAPITRTILISQLSGLPVSWRIAQRRGIPPCPELRRQRGRPAKRSTSHLRQ